MSESQPALRVSEEQLSRLRELILGLGLALFERFVAAENEDETTIPTKDNTPVFIGDKGTFRKVEFKSNLVPNYSSLVGKIRGYGTPIGRDEIDEYADLLQYVRSVPSLEAFLGGRRDPSEPVNDHWVEVGIQFIGARLAARHVALAGLDEWHDDVAAEVCDQLETWLVREQLPLQALFPILNVSFDVERIDLSNDLRVERVSDDLRLALEPYGYSERNSKGHMFTHVLIKSGLTLENASHVSLLGGVQSVPSDVSDVEQFFHALTAHTSAPTGWVRVEYRPVGWAESFVSNLPPIEPGIKMDGRVDRSLRPGDEPGDTLDAERSEALAQTYRMVRKTGSALSVPTKRLTDAARRTDGTDALLDLCIGIEALVGDNQGEVVHKIAFRSAAVLAVTGAASGIEPWEWVGIIKKVYGFRSRIAHGRSRPAGGWVVRIDEEDFSAVSVARFVLHQLVEHRVNNPRLDAAAIDEQIIAQGLT